MWQCTQHRTIPKHLYIVFVQRILIIERKTRYSDKQLLFTSGTYKQKKERFIGRGDHFLLSHFKSWDQLCGQ
jgi:hypothetical protein